MSVYELICDRQRIWATRRGIKFEVIKADLISVTPSGKGGLFPLTRATVELVAQGKKFTNQVDMYFGEAYVHYPDAKQKFTLLTAPALGAGKKTDKLFQAWKKPGELPIIYKNSLSCCANSWMKKHSFLPSLSRHDLGRIKSSKM